MTYELWLRICLDYFKRLNKIEQEKCDLEIIVTSNLRLRKCLGHNFVSKNRRLEIFMTFACDWECVLDIIKPYKTWLRNSFVSKENRNYKGPARVQKNKVSSNSFKYNPELVQHLDSYQAGKKENDGRSVEISLSLLNPSQKLDKN